jgi:hypothetical protein
MEKSLESTGSVAKELQKGPIATMVLTGLNLRLEMEGNLVILFAATEKIGGEG